MITNGIEKKLLRKLSEVLLMREEEIKNFLKRETGENPEVIFRAVVPRLLERGLVRYVYTGDACYAITQTGLKEAE